MFPNKYTFIFSMQRYGKSSKAMFPQNKQYTISKQNNKYLYVDTV